jgi:hypothetical protein
MSISRRQFIIGTAAGLVLPSFYDRVFTFFENTGEAYLELPRQATTDLFAAVDRGDGFQLNLGDPYQEPPPSLTYREYAHLLPVDDDEYLEELIEEGIDLDSEMDSYDFIDEWAYRESPNAKAYRLLENLDLGPDFESEHAVGQLQFYDCPGICSDYLGVHAEDEVSLSLLQKRLNELNTGIRITVTQEGFTYRN